MYVLDPSGAYAQAAQEDSRRTAASQDDELIHFWDMTDAPAPCGVDIMTTSYTFGSPERDEVTCKACLLLI